MGQRSWLVEQKMSVHNRGHAAAKTGNVMGVVKKKGRKGGSQLKLLRAESRLESVSSFAEIGAPAGEARAK